MRLRRGFWQDKREVFSKRNMIARQSHPKGGRRPYDLAADLLLALMPRFYHGRRCRPMVVAGGGGVKG